MIQVRLLIAEWLIHLALKVSPKGHPESDVIIFAAMALVRDRKLRGYLIK